MCVSVCERGEVLSVRVHTHVLFFTVKLCFEMKSLYQKFSRYLKSTWMTRAVFVRKKIIAHDPTFFGKVVGKERDTCVCVRERKNREKERRKRKTERGEREKE